ncbi:AcrR family transcriptional regulator [Cryobacterium mesophilum]|uniref:TetR family transcriptional regulator n=1 Tax=Terrimesophilobacter mesophilus TaxID=433647 RepID=A0A4R8V8W2_9MICO|nr:TetR/AcrR family transcriptional regulator [Terrimesophilobacter mesophilus]MBB5632321.1 AcrR family transcriptional regulator [Terrimesophilobacter mesophilus]TFB79163.1 TetR family transcriptional regulator [Terrimesophilobacter mesophilus]
MNGERVTVGRPRASSRGTIEDAAAELFLEQSYDGTTIDEITQRAGVSRATFFNYFSSKSDLLWMDADHAIERLEECLASGAPLFDSVALVAAEVGPERVPLAVTQSDVMGTRDELVASGLARVARVAALVHAAIAAETGQGRGGLALTVRANSVAGAIVAAWGAWIRGGVARRPLSDYISDALALVQL